MGGPKREDINYKDNVISIKSWGGDDIRWYSHLSAIGNLALNLYGKTILPPNTDLHTIKKEDKEKVGDFPQGYQSTSHSKKRRVSADRTGKLLTVNFRNMLLISDKDKLSLQRNPERAKYLLFSGTSPNGNKTERVRSARQRALAVQRNALIKHLEKELARIDAKGTLGANSILYHLYKKALFELNIEKKNQPLLIKKRLLLSENERLQNSVDSVRKKEFDQKKLKEDQQKTFSALLEDCRKSWLKPESQRYNEKYDPLKALVDEVKKKEKQERNEKFTLKEAVKEVDERYKRNFESYKIKKNNQGRVNYLFRILPQDTRYLKALFHVMVRLFLFSSHKVVAAKRGKIDFNCLAKEREVLEKERQARKNSTHQREQKKAGPLEQYLIDKHLDPRALKDIYAEFFNAIIKELKGATIWHFENIVSRCLRFLSHKLGPYIATSDKALQETLKAVEAQLGATEKNHFEVLYKAQDGLHAPDYLQDDSRDWRRTRPSEKRSRDVWTFTPKSPLEFKPLKTVVRLQEIHKLGVGSVHNYGHDIIDVKGKGKDEDTIRFYPHLTLMGNFIVNLLGKECLPKSVQHLPEDIKKRYGAYPKGYAKRSGRSRSRIKATEALRKYFRELFFKQTPYAYTNKEWGTLLCVKQANQLKGPLKQRSALKYRASKLNALMRKIDEEAKKIGPKGVFGANSFLYHLCKKTRHDKNILDCTVHVSKTIARLEAENEVMKRYLQYKHREQHINELKVRTDEVDKVFAPKKRNYTPKRSKKNREKEKDISPAKNRIALHSDTYIKTARAFIQLVKNVMYSFYRLIRTEKVNDTTAISQLDHQCARISEHVLSQGHGVTNRNPNYESIASQCNLSTEYKAEFEQVFKFNIKQPREIGQSVNEAHLDTRMSADELDVLMQGLE